MRVIVDHPDERGRGRALAREDDEVHGSASASAALNMAPRDRAIHEGSDVIEDVMIS